MGSRTWIKIYCDRWVGGTIRDEPPAVRGIFIDLLALAGSGNYGEVGQIKLANEVGLPDVTLQKLLRLAEGEWLSAKERLVVTDRITVTGDNIISIVNWCKYQSEYQRLKEYTGKGTTESTKKSTSLERDRDIERDRDTHTPLFNHWNEQKIITHRELTDDIGRAIKAALKEHSSEEIQAAITNYAEIVHGDDYYFKYKWTLRDFLKRGLGKFLDIEVARTNYRRERNDRAEKAKRNPRQIPGPGERTPTPDYPD